MIFIKSLVKKDIAKKYGLIIGILFLISLVLLNISFNLNDYIYKENNKLEYRTLLVKSDKEIGKKLDKKIIEIKLNEEGYYEIFFKETNDVISFVENYKYMFSDIVINGLPEDDIISTIQIILSSSIALLVVILVIIMIIFTTNMIYDVEKNLALCKLIGFSQKQLSIILFLLLNSYCFFIYIISIIVSHFILMISNKILLSQLLFPITSILAFKNFVQIYFIIMFIIIISFIRIFIIMKKITPIRLMQNY